MANTPVTIDRFPGLRLDVPIDELGFDGASDILNIDYVQAGLPQRRPGARVINGYPRTLISANPGTTPGYLYVVDIPGGTPLVLGAEQTQGELRLISYASGIDGAVTNATAALVTPASADALGCRFQRYGDTTPYAFGTLGWQNTVKNYKCNITGTWSAPTYSGTDPKGARIAVTPWDNRLVSTGGGTAPWSYRVMFSDEGLPLTMNEYVDLDPGDSEYITEVVRWENYLVVFKQTKFYVFYGVSTNTDGTPIFEYRSYPGVGAAFSGYTGPTAIAMRDGVYFVNRNGLFRTRGGAAEKVSGPVDPLFGAQDLPSSGHQLVNPYLENLATLDAFGSAASGSAYAQGGHMGMARWDDKVLFSMAAAPGLTLVYDTVDQWWSIWNLPRGGSVSTLGPVLGTQYLSGLLYVERGNAGTDKTNIWMIDRPDSSGNYTVDGDTDEVQTIIATGGTAGNFTLTYSGQTTGTIAYNASAGTVQAALEALSNIAVGEVVCYGGPLPDAYVYVKFTGTLGKQNVAAMTVGTENVTNGNATLATARAGAAGTQIPAHWTSGATDLGVDSVKIVKDVVVTGRSCGIGVELSVDLAAFAGSAPGSQFSGTEVKRLRNTFTNKRGRLFAMRMDNGTASEVYARFAPLRVTLNLLGKRNVDQQGGY